MKTEPNTSEYLVIKLSGNWIEKEQAKFRVKYLLDGVTNTEVLENADVRCLSSKKIPRTLFDKLGDREEFDKYIKDLISKEMGIYLMQEGLINFKEKIDDLYVEIIGSVNVILEGADNGGK